jgi:arsenate reductase (thioredoxin)
MAEAYARDFAPAGLEIYSAGSRPAAAVSELAIEAMREDGYDLSGQYPKTVAEVPTPIDAVITLCGDAAEECPTFPGAKQIEHWGLPDPAMAEGSHDERMVVFREVRDEIKRRLQAKWR